MEGLIFSSWNYIMGPQIEKLWIHNDSGKLSKVADDILHDFNVSRNSKDSLVDENVLYNMKSFSMMCGQLLLSEVDSCKDANKWISRFYMSDNKIIIAVLFHMDSTKSNSDATRKLKDTCCCIGIVFNRKSLKFVLEHQLLLDVELRKSINNLKKVTSNSSDAAFNDLAKTICETISSLGKVNVRQPLLSWLSFQELNTSFLSKTIASHLQTSGHTIVSGSSMFICNQVMQILSLFNLPRDYCCSIAVPIMNCASYIHGICIQKAIKGKLEDTEYLLKHASNESCSLTIVDIDVNNVWQTMVYANSTKNNRNFANLVTESGILIPKFLSDIELIEKMGGDWKLFVKEFYESLITRSLALIQYLESCRPYENLPHPKDIMARFAVNDLTDLKVLFGCAEKFKPGYRARFSNIL